MDPIRLQKFLASATRFSRRKAEEAIQQGRVTVNGRLVTEMGTKIDPAADTVTLDNEPVKLEEKKVYLLMYKPRGVLCTTNDPEGRPVVGDLLENVRERVFPVGRLDMDSEGLLLLTNDGDLALKLMHPRFEVKKTYQVLTERSPSDSQLAMLRQGVMLDDTTAIPLEVRISKLQGRKTWVKVVISEGKKRQVRRMFEKVSLRVLRLRRVALASLTLRGLKPGTYRSLTPYEIRQLKAGEPPAAPQRRR